MVGVGTQIRRARKTASLTQTELAALVGVSRQSVAKWESGKCLPNCAHIALLANALHIDVSHLMSFTREAK